MVMVGSVTGREAQIAAQRRRRGLLPSGANPSLSYLFDDGQRWRSMWWIVICAVVGAAAFGAVTTIGVTVGERLGLAVGSGILASLTVIGSAAAEAYGTNLGADLVRRRTRELRDADGAVRRLEHMKADMMAGIERAAVAEQQLHHAALARAGAANESDRFLRDPERWGGRATDRRPPAGRPLPPVPGPRDPLDLPGGGRPRP